MSNDKYTIYMPFFQVKVAGRVVEHTNSRAEAHDAMKDAWAKPVELWRISQGSAELLERRI